jgi:osmotically inducible protein OsmC
MPEEDPRMAVTRFAEFAWKGDLMSGTGSINYVSSGAFTRLPVTWASRTEAHDGRTSPEELIASAHASCVSMAFSGALARNGTPATSLTVTAVVTFDKTDAGWRITKSELTVAGVVPGLDQAKFAEIANGSKDGCPVSQALKGNVELSVVATLAA